MHVQGYSYNIIPSEVRSTTPIQQISYDTNRGGQMGAKEPIVAPPGFFVALG